MQQHGSKYFGCRPLPPLPLGIGSVGQIQLFQNISNQERESQMQQLGSKYFALRPQPSDPRGQKVKL